METKRIIKIIDDLQEKLNYPFANININHNNINNNFQNFNQFDAEEILNQNNNRNMRLNKFDNIDENYIKNIVKEELKILNLPNQMNLEYRINSLESKIKNIELNKINMNRDIDKKPLIDYENKISEIEKRLSEIESFFISWKEIMKNNDYDSYVKNSKEQEIKFMNFKSEINDEINKIHCILKTNINNDMKNVLNQINNRDSEINNLEKEIKSIKVDFDYLNKDINDIKSYLNSELKSELYNINQKNNNFIKDIKLLKEDIEKMNKFKPKVNEEFNRINNINNLRNKNSENIIKISVVDEIIDEKDENFINNNIINNNN